MSGQFDLLSARPIRKGRESLVGGKVTILNRPTRVSHISVTCGANDVNVNFRNGTGGEILWSIEADNSGGSASEDFSKPLLFTRGVVAEVGVPANLIAICVAVVEPASSGT